MNPSRGDDRGSSLVQTVLTIDAAIDALFRLATSRRVHAEFQRRSAMALTATEWELLRRVDDLGPISVSHAAGLIGRSVPVASRALGAMERGGLVERQPDPSDRRVTMCVTSAKGADARVQFHQTMLDEIGAAIVQWSREEQLAFAGLLDRFVADVRRADPNGTGRPEFDR